MSVFSEEEIAYLNEQRLGRLATVGSDNQPHVVPVGFKYDAGADAIHIGGYSFASWGVNSDQEGLASRRSV